MEYIIPMQHTMNQRMLGEKPSIFRETHDPDFTGRLNLAHSAEFDDAQSTEDVPNQANDFKHYRASEPLKSNNCTVLKHQPLKHPRIRTKKSPK